MFMVMALPKPRSDTKAAVTVTQQSATCAASRTSRSAQRCPAAEDWIAPLLIASFGSVLNISRSGISPNTTPASSEISIPIRINDGCGCTTEKFMGYSVGGCQLARPVRAIQAKTQAHAPPQIEI